jgi:AAA+ superfamily predicted ATPase
MKKQECPVIVVRTIENTLDALENINSLIDNLEKKELTVAEFHMETAIIFETHKNFELFKQFNSKKLNPMEQIITCFVIWKAFTGSFSVSINAIISALCIKKIQEVTLLQGISNRVNPIIEHGFLENKEGFFLNNVELGISQNTVEILKEEGILIEVEKSPKSTNILPEKIHSKILFYNQNEKEQLKSIFSTIQEKNYQNLKSRFQSKGLPLGVTVLLFGKPGTGKTETVLQLAKQTGREIIKIDISKTKSKWFGDSEKLIKQIFQNYENQLKKSILAPILLFNEADAILSTRTSKSESNTSQTENAIQNILLEELENFEGIFIATTNLVGNLDKAFDRRFLYKLELSKPELKQRISIWKNKIDFLTLKSAKLLAEKFDLSGGQIDNIVRKCEVNHLLKNENPTLESLVKYCEQEETLSIKNRNAIGFR